MICPFCRHEDTKVSDSRAVDDGSAIRRRRVCPACERKFTTIEQVLLTVIKRSGVVEAFSREKVIRGVRKACQGRPVAEAQLAGLGQRVEEELRSAGKAEIASDAVGVAILGPLAELDSVAYLRFASVYKNYETVEDFESEIHAMRERLTAAAAAAEGPPEAAPRAGTSKVTAPPSQEPLIG
ncbi:MAG: transcriptional regulator NrdR [Arachnia sp.]